VVMSVGEKTDIGQFETVPDNIRIKNTVDQIAVLGQADVFITHSGMNSVSESLYQGVPMVLYPTHSEQKLAAQRVAELGAGIILKNDRPQTIREAVNQILVDPQFRRNAAKISGQFRNAGGASAAADVILSRINRKEP
jgi:MGT family glycosyltransferase